MLVWNNQLVNLGSYNNPCQRVSVWDGTSWSCLGGGVGIVARAGCVWNGNLVVVGDFWNNFQPCTGCNGIAMWDGSQWLPFDNGFNNDVLTCTVFNGDLIIGGDFTQADGVPVSRVVRWNDVTGEFESMGAPSDFDNDVRCMTEFEGELWVGGDFNNVGGNSPSDGLVKWDDATQSWVGGNSGVDLVGGVNESVRVLYVNPNDGNLYMGGEFPELWDGDAAAEDYNMSGVAMYDGSNWYSLGSGLNDYCRAMHEYNGNLIVGGYFTTADGVACNRIAKWNGTTFQPMGLGFDGVGIDEYVKSATVWNGIFFAGGAYTQAEGQPMNYIAQWFEPITDPPVASINPSANSGCEGLCVDFTDMSTNNPDSWTWNFPGATTTTSSVQHPQNICYPTAGTYTAELTACNGNGCNTTTVNITVESTPTLTVNNATICDGGSATLTAVPSAGGGTFLWSPGGETTSSITVSPASSTLYFVEYTLNGCTSSLTTASVTVEATPSVSVNNDVICVGQTANLTAVPSTGGGTYLWSPGGETSSSISVSPGTTTSYSVVYTLNGCQSTPAIADVSVNPTYNLNENITVCEGSVVIYPDGSSETITGPSIHTNALTTVEGCDSIIITNVTAAPNYNQSENVQVCSGSTVVYPDGTSEIITGPAVHTSLLTSIEGCDSVIITNVSVAPDYNESENVSVCRGSDYTYPDGSTTTNVQTDEIHTSLLSSVYGCDSVVITYLTVDPLPDNSVSLSGITISAVLSGATYQWLDCDNSYAQIPGETNQSFTPAANGNYAVLVTLNSCSDTSACQSVTTIGVEENQQADFTIYPNPVTETFVIVGEGLLNHEFYISDDLGRIVLTGNVSSGDLVSIDHLSSGTYTVFIKESDQKIRLIKM